jgi:hypothetical protein
MPPLPFPQALPDAWWPPPSGLLRASWLNTSIQVGGSASQVACVGPATRGIWGTRIQFNPGCFLQEYSSTSQILLRSP